MFTARTLAEGKWAILICAALLLATMFWRPARWVAPIPAVLLVFVVSFFRDPERAIAVDPREILSPADGKVVEVREVENAPFLGGRARMVAIFLSVFNVHVQRMPVAGTIKASQYQPGQFLDARHPECGAQNEARWIGIESADGYRCAVRQVAGLIARRIVCWAGDGETLAKGDRYGMIRFGSRVELYLPLEAEVTVRVGEKAKGGTTVLAKRK